MEILKIQSYPGRNIYSHKPVIRMELDLKELFDIPTKDIQDFNNLLVQLFPGLQKHKCSRGYEGGFLERLQEGTYLAHVTEHLILELQNILGFNTTFGKARVTENSTIYSILFEYGNEPCGIECARASVNIIHLILEEKKVDVDSVLKGLKQVCSETELGPSTRAIFEEARKRGIPVLRMGNDSILQLGTGKYRRLIEASLTDRPNCISVDIASNKHLTKQILMDYHIPVPYGGLACTEDAAISLAMGIGYPVVVKPLDGNQGKGVTLGIMNEEEIRCAYKEAVKYSKSVVVEKCVKGKDYRILVVGDKVSAVSERRPPQVVGDGIHTVEQLVEIENENPLRGEDHEKPLTKIKIDMPAKQLLKRYGISEKSVPAEGEIVNLRENGNLSTGGTARDCTDEVHPYNCFIAIKAAKAIGMDIAGVDIKTEDISRPISNRNGVVLEINAAPGLRMHLYPTEGQARDVASDIIEMMYPENANHSVPIVSVTGTNGKTTTTRLIQHTIALTGLKVGMTSTSGIYIGDECVLKGDNTGPISARMVLADREVEAAVLETARGGIIKRGLGYDLADVGVVVNISDDHLGLDGINTMEELAFVKSLVIEAVRPDGYAVINADDKMAEYCLDRVRSKAILFTRNKNNPIVLRHIRNGGIALFTDNGSIYICGREQEIQLICLCDIPITFNGQLECNIENSLAAASALYALNIPLETIREGLNSFKPDIVDNPGRFNLFDIGSFKVMLDYGHNPAGYSSVLKFVRKLDVKRLVGIIGVPGDRLDRNIKDVGELCGEYLHKIYIKEDIELRGRAPGEVAGILYEAAVKSGMKKDNVDIIFSEVLALETAMRDGQPGDLVILFYEELEPVLELLKQYKKESEEGQTGEGKVLEKTAG